MRKSFIINTNRTNCPKGVDEMDMLQNKKCAAYFSPWKDSIETIQPNDMIFYIETSKVL